MDDLPIPAVDQERIDGMVQAYRRSLENFYRMAWLQGGMTQVELDREALKRKVGA